MCTPPSTERVYSPLPCRIRYIHSCSQGSQPSPLWRALQILSMFCKTEILLLSTGPTYNFCFCPTVLQQNKVHTVYPKISVPYAVVYIMLWYTFANPFCGPKYPQNCKHGPKKAQSPRKCTFYNIIRYFIGHYSLYYH